MKAFENMGFEKPKQTCMNYHASAPVPFCYSLIISSSVMLMPEAVSITFNSI